MKQASKRSKAGYTLLELLIGMSLSLMIMTAMLSSYVTLGRNFTRSLGLASASEPPLESQGRRAITYLTQDVRLASNHTNTLNDSEVTLVIPSSTGTRNITYYYNSSTSAATVYSVSVKPRSLTRIDRSTNTGITLQTNLLSCSFTYYDVLGNPYTTYTNYLRGIKGLSLSSTSQAGSSVNGTLSMVYQTTSAPLLFRNKGLL